jgi:hypothetical protein
VIAAVPPVPTDERGEEEEEGEGGEGKSRPLVARAPRSPRWVVVGVMGVEEGATMSVMGRGSRRVVMVTRPSVW